MTLWMLLGILTLTACGGDDIPDVTDTYKGVAVDKSDVVGKTIGHTGVGTTIHKLTFNDGTNYTYKVTGHRYSSDDVEENGTYTLKKEKGYTLLRMTKSTGGAGRLDNGRMYYLEYDTEKTAIFIGATMFVFLDD